MGYLLRLAASNLAGSPGRRLLVGLGVAAGAAVLGASLVGSVVAADAKLSRTLGALPPAERSVHVAHFGIARDRASHGDLDRTVRGAVGPLKLGQPVRVLQFKEADVGGGLAILAGIDDAERWVQLRSGRLPRTCSPRRCEVLRLGGAGRVEPADGFPVVVVGRADLSSALPFGRLLGVGGGRISEVLNREDSPPFLLAEGVEATAGLPRLATTYRSYAWVFPLEQVHAWQADQVRARLDDAQATLHAKSFAFEVDAPTAAIAAATEEASVAGRRLLIVGGQAAALLLAFTILGAETLRREFLALRRRLTWFGARRRQIALVAALDFLAVTVAATVIGWLVAAGAGAAIARRAGVPVGDVLRQSLFSTLGLVAALTVAVMSALALLAMVYAARNPSGRRISAIDVAAAAALAGMVLALSRGAADPEALANEGGSVALVLLLPALALFVAAALFARIFVPALEALSRPAARLSDVRLRLPLLALARNPGRAAIAASFLVVSVGGALFALTYRATLERGVDDRVHYAYPLDFVVRENLARANAGPLDVAPLSRYGALGEDVVVVPAIRRHASLPKLAGVETLTALALPAAQLPTLSGWRDDFSELGRSEIARRLAPPNPVGLRGVRLPSAATAVGFQAQARGDAVGLEANILNAEGGFTTVELGVADGGEPTYLVAELPPQARGGLLVALTLNRALDVEGHGQGNVPLVEGTLTLGPLEADTGERRQALARWPDWRGDGGVSVVDRDKTVRLSYTVTNDIGSRFRPRQPLDDGAVPVLATPALAAAADDQGLLPLRLPGGELTARVVATARYFPTLDGDFVVADEATLSSALNARRPGAAVTNEIWLGASSAELPRIERALRDQPFSALELETSGSLEATLEDDPLARGTVLALTATAFVALGLALVGLVLLVRGDLDDERGELFDLEAQGADPRLLTFHVRGRAALVAVAGTLAGLASGAALAGLVVSVVTVTAGGTSGLPPLDLVLDWRGLALTWRCSGRWPACSWQRPHAMRSRHRFPDGRRAEQAARPETGNGPAATVLNPSFRGLRASGRRRR